MTAILTGIADVTTGVGDIFGMITGNAYLLFFCSCSVVGACIGVFKGLKNGVRR